MSAASRPRRPNPTLKLFSPDELAAADAGWVDGLSPKMTLPEFGAVYVIGQLYAERRSSPQTIEIMQTALSLWAELTENRPLEAISDRDTSLYITGLYKPDRKQKSRAPATVDKYRRAAQFALNLAGPRAPRQRKAKSLIDVVPYIEPQEIPEPEEIGDFALDEIAAMLGACAKMTRPREHDFGINYRGQKRTIKGTGIPPADWWDALLVFAFNTAERRGALFGIGLPPAEAETVTFQARIRKGGRKKVEVPLNPAAKLALGKMLAVVRDDRTQLFPWPHCRRHFYTLFHRLQTLAGIPPDRQRGLHGIRKATATEVASFSPMAAQLLLGHRDGTLLEKHYVGRRIKQEALAKLRQPGETQ